MKKEYVKEQVTWIGTLEEFNNLVYISDDIMYIIVKEDNNE